MINTILSGCSDGCLKCDSNKNRCLLCDITAHFKIQNGGCVLRELENCVLNNNQGQCLACKENFFLDLSSLKCVEIVEELLIENCAVYGHRGTCIYCKENYFLKQQECLNVETAISNCNYHNSQGLCLMCKPNSVLSLDQLSCSDSQSIAKCSTYSYSDCYSCNQEFTKNRNNYLYEMFGFQNSENYKKLYQKLMDINSNFIDGQKFNICQRNIVPYCQEFQTFNTCK